MLLGCVSETSALTFCSLEKTLVCLFVCFFLLRPHLSVTQNYSYTVHTVVIHKVLFLCAQLYIVRITLPTRENKFNTSPH